MGHRLKCIRYSSIALTTLRYISVQTQLFLEWVAEGKYIFLWAKTMQQ